MNAKIRFWIGMFLLLLSVTAPLATLLIPQTSWSLATKASVGSLLFFSFEIFLLMAIAIMGKDNYEWIRIKFIVGIRKVKPAGNIGKTRHFIGLLLFFFPLIFRWIQAYIPLDSTHYFYLNISTDVIFLISFFVLGGDFWDKLYALFKREARAHHL